MEKYLEKVREKYPKLSEIFRFLVVGTIATIIDMFVMAMVIYKFNGQNHSSFFDVFASSSNSSSLLVTIATGIGFVVGLVVNYFLSIYYVYQGENRNAKTKKGFLLFAILSFIGLLIQTVGMYIGLSMFHFNEWLIKIVLVFVVLIFNYITRKIFIFKNSDKINEQIDQIEKPHKEINLVSIGLNALFSISLVCLMFLLYRRAGEGLLYGYDKFLLVVYAPATFLMAFLFLSLFTPKWYEKIICANKAIYFSSVFISLIISWSFYERSLLKFSEKLICWFGSIFSFFVLVFFMISIIIDRVKAFYKNMDKIERKIFYFIIIAGLLLGLFFLLITDIFVGDVNSNNELLSFDTGWMVYSKLDIFSGGSDFRHFLMIAAYPFIIIPYILYLIFRNNLAYGLALYVVQVILMAYCIIVLLRLLKIENKKSKILVAVFLSLSAGFLINMLCVEKFVISFFYIIATLNLCEEENDLKWLTLVGAVGMLSTNILLLPIVLFYKKKDLKTIATELMSFAIIFIGVMIIFGQLNLVFSKKSYLAIDFSSVGRADIGFLDKFIQAVSFLAYLFLCPNIRINERNEVAQATSQFNIFAVIGVVILILMIVSVVINRKDKLTRICAIWSAFTLFALLIVGWGSALDEMFIYSLVFGWSIICLIIKLIQKIKNKKIKTIICLSLTILMIGWNIYELIRIVYYSSQSFKGVFLALLK